MDELGLNASLK